MTLVLTGTFVLSLAAALLFVPLVREGARRLRWTDAPDGERKLHPHPTPAVGGVALVAAFVVGVNGMQLLGPFAGAGALAAALAPPTAVVLGAGLIAALGLLDDLLDLGYRTKLLGQAQESDDGANERRHDADEDDSGYEIEPAADRQCERDHHAQPVGRVVGVEQVAHAGAHLLRRVGARHHDRDRGQVAGRREGRCGGGGRRAAAREQGDDGRIADPDEEQQGRDDRGDGEHA